MPARFSLTAFICFYLPPTGKSGKIYNYYICNSARVKQCDKKTISKEYLENLVIKETKKLLTDKNIEKIAKEVVALCEKERNTDTTKHLKHLIKENEKAMENLSKALEQGQITDIIIDRISQKKAEQIELEKQLANEEVRFPKITVSHVKFFLERFKNGDVNDLKYRKALVDTFIRRIMLFEDKMTILYNTQDGQTSLSLDDECSPKGTMVELSRSHMRAVYLYLFNSGR